MLSKPNHFAGLDGLRGVAAILVLILHAIAPFIPSQAIPRAGLAVDFFFLLSGFVIACAYEGRLLSNRLSFWGFVRIRIIRLYPLALLGFALGLAVFLTKASASRQSLGAPLFAAWAAGIFILPTPVQLAPGWASAFPFNPPAWSLFFEFFINLAYVAVLRRLTLRGLACLVVLSGAAMVVQESLVGHLGGGGDWSNLYLGFARVTFPFFFGVLLFRLQSRMRVGRKRWQAEICTLLLLIALLFPASRLDLLLENVAIFALFPLIVLLRAGSEPPTSTNRAFLLAGQLSYPLYILHYPFIHVFSSYFRAQQFSGVRLYGAIVAECVCVIVIVFAVLRWFDEPVRRWLSRRPESPSASPKSFVRHAG